MAVKAAFSNQGQICLCGSRLFVQREIYEPFKAALLKKEYLNLKLATQKMKKPI